MIINFKVRGVGQDSVPCVMEIILNHISVRCGVVALKELHHATNYQLHS